MNWFKRFIRYYKDNPEGYWFKRKLYGWGWMPVRWQGWLVTAIGTAIIAIGIYVGEVNDAPGIAFLGILFAAALVFAFGYWKGEKPQWQWDFPEDEESE